MAAEADLHTRSRDAGTAVSVAIVGAGFSGSLLAFHLASSLPPGSRIALIERTGRFGTGLAYGTGNPNHLLNVPACGMSALPDRPDHLVEWLSALPPGTCPSVPAPMDSGAFVSRRIYGAYVRDLLEEAERAAAGGLVRVTGRVVDLAPAGDGVVLDLAGGGRIRASRAVLALGNFEPAPVRVLAAHPGAYRNDPWAPGALEGIDPDAAVLLVGTGLTTVDAFVSLLDRGHRGVVYALSRRGLLPRVHAAPPAPALAAAPDRLPRTAAALVRGLRAAAAAETARGGDWRAPVDGVRAVARELWEGLPDAERARLLRHARPWWDVHRHRLAPGVAARLRGATEDGRFRILAGRLASAEADGEGLAVSFRPRSGGPAEILRVARAVNCTGPAGDWSRAADPLPRALLARGLAAPDPLGLGVAVSEHGALLGADGAPSPALYGVGPVTRARSWEVTAVPDIRGQAKALAERIAADLTARAEP
jgi:uncharacterized NAD(P)/FAD-binding protein YdhS